MAENDFTPERLAEKVTFEATRAELETITTLAGMMLTTMTIGYFTTAQYGVFQAAGGLKTALDVIERLQRMLDPQAMLHAENQLAAQQRRN